MANSGHFADRKMWPDARAEDRMTEPDYILDVDGLEPDGVATPDGTRKWLGVRFECCGAYQRVYRNATGLAYEGRCPHCLRPIYIAVGPGGVDTRFFRAE